MKQAAALADHFQRSYKALTGFQIFGRSWIPLWLFYIFSPLLSRILGSQEWSCGLCRFRTDQGDAYTFANIFEDYPVADVSKALIGVEKVIDAGANVGAFSLLVMKLTSDRPLEIVALEPMDDNVALLQRQPFARSIKILPAALGPHDGHVAMHRGFNSVTHFADFTSASEKDQVPMYGLAGLCDRPTLLKMDIEGGEHAVLAAGLPENVTALFLEWHPIPGEETSDPRSLIPRGLWRQVSSDIYGSSMWFWQAKEA